MTRPERSTINEVEIIYFIMSHTDFSLPEPQFQWPVLPVPEMGEQFCERIKRQHRVIERWIIDNPKKYKLAQKGYYKKDQPCQTLN